MAVDQQDLNTMDLLSNPVGRPRKHKDDAAKQRAYRARLKLRKLEKKLNNL